MCLPLTRQSQENVAGRSLENRGVGIRLALQVIPNDQRYLFRGRFCHRVLFSNPVDRTERAAGLGDLEGVTVCSMYRHQHTTRISIS